MANEGWGSLKKTNSLARSGLWMVCLLVLNGEAAAQIGGRVYRRFLIMNPVPEAGTDSSFAVELGDKTRERLISRLRFKVRTVSSDQICEALAASGFLCNVPLAPVMVTQLANVLTVDAYATWTLGDNSGNPTATIRLVDRSRSGLSGWISTEAEPGADVRGFADQIVDLIDDQLNVARHARECYEKRDRQDYRGAKERALRAFREQPNHPAAASCLATVYEADRQPLDSIIQALELAVTGDSLLGRSWRRLGQLYMQLGDTTRAASAFESQLQSNPSDLEVRLGVAAIYYRLGNFSKTRAIIEPAVEQNPNDLQVLRIWIEACLDGQMWDCALASLARRYEIDSTVHGDEAFYGQIFAAAQALSDTAAMLRWSGEAVERVPESISLWRARAQALKEAGINDSAVAAYMRVADLDPTDFRSTLNAAQIVLGELVIDSVVALDSAAIGLADSLLQITLARDSSNATRMNVAVAYLRPGMSLAQNRHYNVAVDWLDKSLANDVRGRLTIQANFFLGFSIFFIVTELDNEVTDTQSCSLMVTEAELVAKGKRALTIGASVSQRFADQILPFYGQYEARIPQMRAAFGC